MPRSPKDWRPGGKRTFYNFEETMVVIPTAVEWWGSSPLMEHSAEKMALYYAGEMGRRVYLNFPRVRVGFDHVGVSEGPDADMIDEWIGMQAESVKADVDNFEKAYPTIGPP